MDGERLGEYGIDYQKGLRNCMDDLPFYKKILEMFLNDDCFPLALEAYKNRNYAALFERVHELKGTSGNAALIELYNSAIPLIELLRRGCGRGDDAEVDRLFAAFEAAYRRTCEGITLYVA